MSLLRSFPRAGVALAASLLFPISASAQNVGQTSPAPTVPTNSELARVSLSGNYLAGRHADQQREISRAAAHYRAALRGDGKNPELLERAFLAYLADGEVEEAIKLAEWLVQADKAHRMARLVLGIRSIKQKQFGTAKQQLTQPVKDPVGELTAALLTGWALHGAGDTKAAVEHIDRLSGQEWYAIFKDMHAGMMLDTSSNKKEAGKRLERANKSDPQALRVVEAYARWASRNAGKDEALKILRAFDKLMPRHPLITEATEEVNRGAKLTPLIGSAQAGAAEALYGLAASLGRQSRSADLFGMVYLQLALYLAPGHPLALLSLADIYENAKKPTLAIRVYERVPQTSPLRRNADIQIGVNLDTLDKTDDAKKHLQTLIAARPDDHEATLALANILRARKQFAECGEFYGRAITQIGKPERGNWATFYFRGICHERDKKWDKAEADFKQALELFPDQPHVLNYLGYSWIDQGINLDEGMKMIKRAVDQRQDDGYIVDSLGWAYYRIGDFEEAVKHLERAVELRPEDPTINDHLGDAYWKVGRRLEAQFQWSHARDLKPESDELEKILAKLRGGLTEETSSAEAEKNRKAPGGGG